MIGVFALGLFLGLSGVVQHEAVDEMTTGSVTPGSSHQDSPGLAAATRTTVFGAWTLRCMGGALPDDGCEIVQSLMLRGQLAPVAQIAVGRLEAGGPLNVTVLLPNNVTLQTSPQLSVEAAGFDPVQLAWRRCLPEGCLSSAEVSAGVLAEFSGTPAPGRLFFQEGSGGAVALPVPFDGFGEALAALGKAKR